MAVMELSHKQDKTSKRCWSTIHSTDLLVCGGAVRLPHVFPLDLTVLLVLLLIEERLEAGLQQAGLLPGTEEQAAVSEGQEAEH